MSTHRNREPLEQASPLDHDREFAITVILQQITAITQKMYLNLEDLAAITSLSPGKLTEMMSAGELPQTRAGTRRLVSCYDLAVWMYENHLVNFRGDGNVQ